MRSIHTSRTLTASLALALTAGLASALSVGLTAGPAAASAAGQAGPVHRPSAKRAAPIPADDGAAVVGAVWRDSRMVDLEISSPAVDATVPARVLLPSGWSSQAERTWPVLYLLQGAHDDYTSWTRDTDIESFASDKDAIVVMPSAGPTGLPTDWSNGGKGKPDYETFQVTELMQLLQRDYRAGTVRAVAGVSTGGYGAIMMAAHHPGAFTAAASYSGILDTTYPGMPDVLDAIVAREYMSPDSLWGDPDRDEPVWAADNPYAQATRLRGTALFISCGTGQNGSAPDLGGTLESALWQQSLAFTARLSLLGIPAQTDLYPGGVHDWPSWEGEFNKSWPLLSASLGLSL
jgi:diacylglycerol O-acyltransferase/trehalose O-mycolyltransferase